METMKKFLIFSQKKAFLVFHETEAPPKKIPYISGNWNSKKLFIYQERGSKLEKNKQKKLGKCLKFPEIALSFLALSFLAPSLKNLIYFRRNFQSMKIKNSLNFFSHFMFAEGELFKHKHKRKAFLISSLYRSNFSN